MFGRVRIMVSHGLSVALSAAAPWECKQLGPPKLGARPGSAILSTDRTREDFGAMPIATPEVYAEMLDRAKEQGFAYPAINVTSSQTLNAALRGFADAESDGIIQVSTGGAEYLSGATVKDMVTGASALASFARTVAAKYPVNIALHTDHCPQDKLDGYMRPLLAISAERVARGEDPLFQSHMWDGSAVPLAENLHIATELLDRCNAAHVVMEMEIGVVGGEEDGVVGEINEKLYSTPEDALATAEALGLGERGRYILAATFGNVHGVYKPGHVKLRPGVLKEIQEAVGAKYGRERPFDLVFHGGSGSDLSDIREAIGYGVVKMNVDTDTQYAFTRPVAGHMFTNYDGVLKVDGDVGNKKAYDPRSWGKAGEAGMSARVVLACEDLLSAGKMIR
jgi:fructose-bisphosphate aldolase class II